MAFTFGDSYLKLPPITNESAVEIDGENSKKGSSTRVRDKHGLVRLPPIVRLDSLRSTPLRAQSYSMKSGTKTDESESEMPAIGSSLKTSTKMGVLQQGSSYQERKYTEKREDQMKLINEPAVKETKEVERRFFDGDHQSKGEENTGRFPSKAGSKMGQSEDEVALLSADSIGKRRGSTMIRKAQKLSRSRRLAKSSPELSNRKITLEQQAGVLYVKGNTVTSRISPELFPESSSRTLNARLSVHDIDGSVLSHLRNTAKSEEKPKLREKRSRSQKSCLIRQPLSTPNSPVCSKSANTTEYKQKGRKSLNDITETVKQFIDRRRPSISLPKKQNLIDNAEGLKIEGKSCPRGEKDDPCPSALSPIVSLQPPQVKEKRHSLYDLHQILSLLQDEDLRQPASSNGAPADSSSSASNGSESNKSSNASVNDLREFLKSATAAEASKEKQLKKTPENTLISGKMQGSPSTNLLPPDKEPERLPAEDARRGSVYDLMEFLSLGSSSHHAGSTSTSQASSRSTSPRGAGGKRDWLSVGETGSNETRRSSTYDLMEFLSLPRSGASSRPESGKSNASYQSDSSTKSTDHRNDEQKSGRNSREYRSLSVYDLLEFLSMTSDAPALAGVKTSGQGGDTTPCIGRNGHDETDEISRENRSLSVYDLAEFLSITSGVPPLVRVTTSEETQGKDKANSTQSVQSDKEGIYKKDSLYDLRETLNVMEEERETGSESADNSPESTSAFDAKPREPCHSSFPKSCSRGYSSDSATEASNLQARDNTNTRQMSVYDLREFLSLYAAQQSTQGHQIPSWFTRKFSSASQSGISIHVTDESNRSLDFETDDVFLPVPGGEPTLSEPPKRGSVYDLREFLSILNADDSPLRRRLSSASSSSCKTSETITEPYLSSTKSDRNSTGSGFDTNNGETAQSRPLLSPRQDSGGNVSLYDLGEFLSLLNTDESPLRRRLSSAGDAGGIGEPRSPKNDSESLKSPLHSLKEILRVSNDLEQKRISESAASDLGAGTGDEISIPVPSLATRNEKTCTKT